MSVIAKPGTSPISRAFELLSRDRTLLGLSVVSMAALGIVIYWGLSIEFWRRDDAAYIADAGMWNRVHEEGRWLNFLAFRITRRVDPTLAWMTNMLLVGTGLYLIFRRLLDDSLVALNLAIIGVLFPGFLEQNTWPGNTLPASGVFLASVVAVQRVGLWTLPFAGILSFASMPYLYCLLPLAFLPLGAATGPRGLVRFLMPGLLWAVSLVLGFLVALTVNFFCFGEFGLHFQPWRNANPVTDLASLIANINAYGSQFVYDLRRWLPLWSYVFLGIAVFGLLAAKKYREASPWTAFLGAAYAGIVLLSPYWLVLPAGILVVFRSLLPLAVGVMVLPFVLTDRSARRPLLFATIAAIGIPSWLSTSAGVEWFAKATRAHVENIRRVIPGSPTDYAAVVVDGRAYPQYFERVQREAGLGRRPFFMDRLDDPKRIIPALRELGFRSVRMCPHRGSVVGYKPDAACAAHLVESPADNPCLSESGPVCAVGVRQGTLLLRMMP